MTAGMSHASYPATARLHRPSEFSAAMKGRRLGRGDFFVLSASRPERNPGQVGARLGLVIAKRYAPLAVTRNAIKRVIRDVFRHQRHDLAACDYVVRLHAKLVPASLATLKRLVRAEALAHFQKARRC